jgi:hypothetical protein
LRLILTSPCHDFEKGSGNFETIKPAGEVFWARWVKFLKIRLVWIRQKADGKTMSTVMEIEKAIDKLPAPEFRELAAWIEMRQGVLAGDCAILSEDSLAVDWNKPEEDAAWIHLQSDQ